MTSPLLELPTTACANGLVMSLAFVVGNSPNIYTKEESFYKWPGEQWRLDYRMPPLTNPDVADEFIAFMLKLQGIYGRFLAGDPSRPTHRGIGGGSPKVDGAYQTGNTLNVKDAPLSTLKWLKRGDYFQLGSGASARLYKLVEDANTDGSGDVQLEFAPAIAIAPADNAVLEIANPRGLFRMTSNEPSWTSEPGEITRLGFTALAVVP